MSARGSTRWPLWCIFARPAGLDAGRKPRCVFWPLSIRGYPLNSYTQQSLLWFHHWMFLSLRSFAFVNPLIEPRISPVGWRLREPRGLRFILAPSPPDGGDKAQQISTLSKSLKIIWESPSSAMETFEAFRIYKQTLLTLERMDSWLEKHCSTTHGQRPHPSACHFRYHSLCPPQSFRRSGPGSVSNLI